MTFGHNVYILINDLLFIVYSFDLIPKNTILILFWLPIELQEERVAVQLILAV